MCSNIHSIHTRFHRVKWWRVWGGLGVGGRGIPLWGAIHLPCTLLSPQSYHSISKRYSDTSLGGRHNIQTSCGKVLANHLIAVLWWIYLLNVLKIWHDQLILTKLVIQMAQSLFLWYLQYNTYLLVQNKTWFKYMYS